MSNAKVSLNPLVKSLDKIKLCVLKNLSRDLLCALDPDVILIFLVLGYLERMLGLSLVILLAFSDGHWSPSPARRRPQNSLWIYVLSSRAHSRTGTATIPGSGSGQGPTVRENRSFSVSTIAKLPFHM